jgi:hypothetical protein
MAQIVSYHSIIDAGHRCLASVSFVWGGKVRDVLFKEFCFQS